MVFPNVYAMLFDRIAHFYQGLIHKENAHGNKKDENLYRR